MKVVIRATTGDVTLEVPESANKWLWGDITGLDFLATNGAPIISVQLHPPLDKYDEIKTSLTVTPILIRKAG